MAKLWGDWIIDDKKTYSEVPAWLKSSVRAYLISKGRVDKITE